jgi:hypothetical protein
MIASAASNNSKRLSFVEDDQKMDDQDDENREHFSDRTICKEKRTRYNDRQMRNYQGACNYCEVGTSQWIPRNGHNVPLWGS